MQTIYGIYYFLVTDGCNFIDICKIPCSTHFCNICRNATYICVCITLCIKTDATNNATNGCQGVCFPVKSLRHRRHLLNQFFVHFRLRNPSIHIFTTYVRWDSKHLAAQLCVLPIMCTLEHGINVDHHPPTRNIQRVWAIISRDCIRSGSLHKDTPLNCFKQTYIYTHTHNEHQLGKCSPAWSIRALERRTQKRFTDVKSDR